MYCDGGWFGGWMDGWMDGWIDGCQPISRLVGFVLEANYAITSFQVS